jgi:hypothetical protein
MPGRISTAGLGSPESEPEKCEAKSGGSFGHAVGGWLRNRYRLEAMGFASGVVERPDDGVSMNPEDFGGDGAGDVDRLDVAASGAARK